MDIVFIISATVIFCVLIPFSIKIMMRIVPIVLKKSKTVSEKNISLIFISLLSGFLLGILQSIAMLYVLYLVLTEQIILG